MRLGRLALWLRRLIWLCAISGVAAYGAAAVVTVADIIGRRFDMPITGVVDLVQLFVFTGAWLVMPQAFLSAAHVGVDFVVDHMPARPALFFRAGAGLLTFGLLSVLLWTGTQTFLVRRLFGDVSQQLGIPIAWFWYPLLAGLALSLLAVTLEFDARRQGDGRSPNGPAHV